MSWYHRRQGEGVIWFLRLILILLLVIGGVELNPGLPCKQDELNQILAHVRSGMQKESHTNF
jgi:hypothetical protein